MEIWEIVDENGVGTGRFCKRSERDEIPEGLYHPVVEVWVIVGDKILLTQRHPNKWAGLMWEASGGAAVAGESLICGAVRELAEETGISVACESLTELGMSKRGKSLIVSYFVRLDTLPEIKIQESEVVNWVLADEAKLLSMWDELTEGTRERYVLYKDSFI